LFEHSAPPEETQVTRARAVFDRADSYLKANATSADRVLLLESYRDYENSYGDPHKLENKMPRVVKKRRRLEDGGWEEYFDYVWPEEGQQKGLKLLEMARKWKMAGGGLSSLDKTTDGNTDTTTHVTDREISVNSSADVNGTEEEEVENDEENDEEKR